MYLEPWAAKLGIFIHFMFTNLPQCSQSINSLIYVYSIQIPSCFLWVPDHSQWHAQTSVPAHISLDMLGEINFRSKLCLKAAPIFFVWKLLLRQKRRLKVVGTFRKYGWCMHIPNHKNLHVTFSSIIFLGGGKLGKIDENMKISKCCKSSCASSFCFRLKNNVKWTFSLPTQIIILIISHQSKLIHFPNLTIFSSLLLTANFQKPLLRLK